MNDADDDLDIDYCLAPAALPRLTTFYLLAWTAAAAVAFVPMRYQQEALRSSPSVEVSLTATDLTSVVSGISSGGYLFVLALLLIWRRQGYFIRIEPGHYLAIQGAVAWCLSAMNWLQMSMTQQPAEVAAMTAVGAMFAPAVGMPFFFFYLFYRSDDTRNWRLAYIAMAISPFVMMAAAMIFVFTMMARGRSPGDAMSFFALSQLAGAAVMALGIMGAMVDDWRQRRERHWTHWLAAGLTLAGILASGAMMFGLWLAPPAHP